MAPIVEAISNSSVLRLPPGRGVKEKELAILPMSGLTRMAATRKSPLKMARPRTVRSQRQ